MRKIFAIATVAFVFAAQLATPGATQAQDLGSLTRAALQGLERTVSQLDSALQANDPATIRSRATTAINTGESTQETLRAILKNTTDDLIRSRGEAALTQLTSGLAKARQAVSGPDADLKSRVQAARAEIAEAAEEFRPALARAPQPAAEVARPAVQPAGLPAAGDADAGPAVAALLALALALCVGGIRLRRAT